MKIARAALVSLKKGMRPIIKQWRDFWRSPDPLLLHEGGSGEMAVARLRILIVAILLAFILVERDQPIDPQVGRAGLWGTSLAMVWAIYVYILAKKRLYRTWFGFMSSIVDVSLVSAALVTLIIVGRPDMAVSSRVIYPVYFLAIGALALRYDARICVLVGLLGLLQYASIVAFVELSWPSTAPLSSLEYGRFDLQSHYTRIGILFCGVLLSTNIALRKQRLRWLAARDPLTKLINRGFFDERMQAEVARTHRTGRLLSIALIDIDNFKDFNDNFGHVVGDEVLRSLAGVLLKTVRKSDLVARYGGEEFIVLLPETPAEYAVQTAERLRRAVEQTTVTVSIGIAELPTDGKGGRAVVDKADQRLYEAKRNGRNRIVGPQNVSFVSP